MASTPELQPSTLMTALGATIAIIISLVGILYHKLTETDREQQNQLDEGADAFTANSVRAAEIAKDLQAIRDWMNEIEEELDALGLKEMAHQETLLIIKDHHRRNHGEEVK